MVCSSRDEIMTVRSGVGASILNNETTEYEYMAGHLYLKKREAMEKLAPSPKSSATGNAAEQWRAHAT